MKKILKVAHPVFFTLLLCSVLLSLAGCAALGAVASIATPKRTEVKYTGLAGQTVGVMVWADRAAKIEWPSIQLDLANQIQNKLYGNAAKELKQTTWPVPAGSILRYQLDHPGLDAVPITDTAPKLGVTRLIYIEVEKFSTRAEASYQMYRGSVTATFKIVEITGNTAKLGYEENGVSAVFPTKSTSDGTVNGTDVSMYRGTVAGLAQEIVDRLISRETN